MSVVWFGLKSSFTPGSLFVHSDLFTHRIQPHQEWHAVIVNESCRQNDLLITDLVYFLLGKVHCVQVLNHSQRASRSPMIVTNPGCS